MTAPVQLSLPSVGRIDAEFARFHQAHPEVFDRLVVMARDAVARGRSRIGVKAMWEALRWSMWLESGESPRFNNNFTARYARLLVAECPDLAGAIETRSLRS